MQVSVLLILATASADIYSKFCKKRSLKNKQNTKKYKFTAPIRMAGTIAGGPVLAGAKGIKDSVKDGVKTGGKIQDSYESRMSQIGQAKDAESKIIDLYTSGRKSKESELKSRTGKDDKVVKALAKTSFDGSYQRTVDNVFEVSDMVDDKVDREKHLQSYKDISVLTKRVSEKIVLIAIKVNVKNRAQK